MNRADTYSEDDYVTPERLGELREVVKMMDASGVVLRVCACTPKRSDPHACPIDPGQVGFTDFLLGLK